MHVNKHHLSFSFGYYYAGKKKEESKIVSSKHTHTYIYRAGFCSFSNAHNIHILFAVVCSVLLLLLLQFFFLRLIFLGDSGLWILKNVQPSIYRKLLPPRTLIKKRKERRSHEYNQRQGKQQQKGHTLCMEVSTIGVAQRKRASISKRTVLFFWSTGGNKDGLSFAFPTAHKRKNGLGSFFFVFFSSGNKIVSCLSKH